MQPTAYRKTYAGLFLVTLATLAFEILLTRVFSATMWYHFAFMAISIAMFGMTSGAVLVFRFPRLFPVEKTHHSMATSSAAFGVLLAVAFVGYLFVPHAGGDSPRDKFVLPAIFMGVAVPFVFGGVAVTLALTRFPRQVSGLYAADLAGAAAGCVAVLLALRVADVYTAAIACSATCLAGALCFLPRNSARLRVAIALPLAAAVCFCAVNGWLASRQEGLLRIRYVKSQPESVRPEFEKWNTFSRITVWPPATVDFPAGAFGTSFDRSDPSAQVPQKYLLIDGGAATVFTGFDGDTGPVEFLRTDVANLAHWLRPESDVLVIGVGGGRDVLSAIVFGQKRITGVELNPITEGLLRRDYADFTGRLAERPDVHLVADEARSYIARNPQRHDIIVASLIDTWAATAAGAFALSENSLYTVDAWRLFLDRLKPGGVLSFSRWWSPKTAAEGYRTISLGIAALAERGVDDPASHLLVARLPEGVLPGVSVATVLVGVDPFTRADVERFRSVCAEVGFEVVLADGQCADPVVSGLLDPARREETLRSFPLDISAPTDERPFFFHSLSLRQIFDREIQKADFSAFNLRAVRILGLLLITVVALSALCILLPLAAMRNRPPLAGGWPFFVYFAGIGIGFMLVELALMQRLIVFLGHPVYSLSVVLFTILLAGGIGSWMTDRMAADHMMRGGVARFAGLIAALVVAGLAVGPIARTFEGATTPVRILLGGLVVFVPGLFMGMCFPMGIKLASVRHERLTPWFWAINGAMSVTASVLSTAIALEAGIPAAYWIGCACYVAVALVFVRLARRTAA